MSRRETRMGGDRESFPETAWSSILASPEPSNPEWQARMNRLCSQYWRPVYAFVRASWGKSVEDAKDLTQAFFCHLVEGEFVSRYQKELGRFRTFLKGALKIFLAEAHRSSQAVKRGGGRAIVSLDVKDLETPAFLAESKQFSPEERFDQEWARQVMAQGLSRLRKELREEGKEVYLRVYEAYELRPESERGVGYAEVAGALGLKPGDVRNYLHFVRNRLREMLVETVSDYVTTREELLDEMKQLFSG